MTADFRAELTRQWRMHRLAEAIEACREIRYLIEADMRSIPLRPPCRRCGNWPCTCNREKN